MLLSFLIFLLKAFEIAQYFMTMCGSDMSKVGREEFVPAKEFQLRWCQSYLSGLHNVPLQKVYKREYISYIANLINLYFPICYISTYCDQ